MELKDYQQKALAKFDVYLSELTAQREKTWQAAEMLRRAGMAEQAATIKDFPTLTWEILKDQGRLPERRTNVPYSPRKDGLGGPVPNVCLKIPTGGGKTLLAASAVSSIFERYLFRNTGLVLWVVPNEAIYTQTRKHLRNREHPYRHILDKAAAGRVKILEKDSPLHKRDLDTHLCIMLVMLQAANRETKETLKFFRDRGNVHGFFPEDGDTPAHAALIERVPNLDFYGKTDQHGMVIVKSSLGNVLRVERPVVVIDEGQKAYSSLAFKTIEDFNPGFVLELTATPKDRPKDDPPRLANWLVDVPGRDLAVEEMIKLPINVTVKQGGDWRDCLRESLDALKKLDAHSRELLANTGRYIRPIMLVQVERTGKEQRGAGLIHALDVKEFLLTAGLAEPEIAIKTSDVNDLKSPENMDLLSPTCMVRVIITKQALQEGWDCPFAYVLCALAAGKDEAAMAQLVGRIMRQPHARRTGRAPLDECHVFCLHAQTKAVVEAIKAGLERDGMADLAMEVVEDVPPGGEKRVRAATKRRREFENLGLYLPQVLWVTGDTARPLDYEQDILAGLDWSACDMAPMVRDFQPEAAPKASHGLRIDLTKSSNGLSFDVEESWTAVELEEFDPVYATRMLSADVPNPWVAREMVSSVREGLEKRGVTPRQLGALSSYVIGEMRKRLAAARDELAEAYFAAKVREGRIQFRLRTDKSNWSAPKTYLTDCFEDSRPLACNAEELPERSLYSPVFESELNGEERAFACYLDGLDTIRWWHRNVAKAGHYAIQGWRRHKVYPDFILARVKPNGNDALYVIETKGDQLEANLDTTYKRKLLHLLTKHYKFENVMKAGQMSLELKGGQTVVCDMLLMSELPGGVHKLIGA